MDFQQNNFFHQFKNLVVFSLFLGLRAMNEPVLQTLKPLEEIEQEEEDDDGILKEEPESDETLSPISKSAVCLLVHLSQCSKIRKKMQVEKYKNKFLAAFQKINFCTRKKFRTTKNPVCFFQSPKIAFLVVLNFFFLV